MFILENTILQAKKHIPMERLKADSGGIHLSPFLKTSQDIELFLVIGAVTSFNMV